MFLLQNNPLIAEVIMSIKGYQIETKIGCVIAIATVATVATERLRGCGRLDSMFFPQSGSAAE